MEKRGGRQGLPAWAFSLLMHVMERVLSPPRRWSPLQEVWVYELSKQSRAFRRREGLRPEVLLL
jgi:hypothetical protein